MFFRILKKDLRRKKTMNIILLIFVILSTMFASSSANNMVSVYGGIDYYLEKANMSDYVIVTLNSGSENPADEILEKADSITECRKEEIIYYNAKNLKKDGKTYVEYENPGFLTSVKGAKINYFNSKNEVIRDIPKGHIYVGGILADPGKVTIGDKVTLELGDVKKEFIIDGFIKDALLGSPFMGNPRMLMNDEEVEDYLGDEGVKSSSTGAIYYINTDDMKALKDDVSGVTNATFANDVSVLKMTFMLDMLTAGLLMVVSICLILIAFTMLSFTIKFTLNEDFREIGVMKAVGLKNSAIRNLYMVKYLCISVVGALIGYAAGIPFGEMLISSITDRMVIGNDSQVFIGVISTVAVVLIILMFCYSCTKSIKKLSPIDAVRNGETGERYHKKSFMKLTKSRLGSNLFLGMNDVLSKPKQYLSMIVTFTICLLLITMLANAANTLMSDKLLFFFGTTRSDAYYNSTEKIMDNMGSKDENVLDDIISDMEKELEDNNMPADIHVELMYQLPVEYKDTKIQIQMQQCKDTKASDYTYSEGVAPMYENEVAFTPQMLDELGAGIGDKVNIEINGEVKEYIITASFVTMNQLGKCGRLHEDVPVKTNDASSAFEFQIDFKDNPDDKVINERIEKMKDIFDTDKIYDPAGFVDKSTSSSATLKMVKNMVLIISIVIALLITVLMERSFISKETTEIALMKAIGFKTRSVSAQHTLRFVVVMVISGVLSAILNYPFTKIICDRIFAVMGAVSGITYDIRPVEVFLLYPVIMGVVVVIAAWLTSLYTRTIHSDSMGNIE
ncbi:MAG: ABC transporter permease [Eubacterium sp.]|nr:ABC transporter permease [Eubacterium sp.]